MKADKSEENFGLPEGGSPPLMFSKLSRRPVIITHNLLNPSCV